jgi:hypothetical protein
MLEPITAFAATESALRVGLKDAEIDRASFERKLQPCSLERCRGTCCHEGVYVNEEVAVVIKDLCKKNADFFQEIGLDLPKEVIVTESDDEGSFFRTPLRPFPFHKLVENYPEHFDDTACCFLLNDGRCGLQMLAQSKGKHPWFYKPQACWLHPIALVQGKILLHDEESDPYQEGDKRGFSSQTFCGKTNVCGQPAYIVLKDELTFLGQILGRDLIQEALSQT